MSIQGGSLLKSHQGMASEDILEKSLMNARLDCCPRPPFTYLLMCLFLGRAAPFCRWDSGQYPCWPKAACL